MKMILFFSLLGTLLILFTVNASPKPEVPTNNINLNKKTELISKFFIDKKSLLSSDLLIKFKNLNNSIKKMGILNDQLIGIEYVIAHDNFSLPIKTSKIKINKLINTKLLGEILGASIIGNSLTVSSQIRVQKDIGMWPIKCSDFFNVKIQTLTKANKVDVNYFLNDHSCVFKNSLVSINFEGNPSKVNVSAIIRFNKNDLTSKGLVITNMRSAVLIGQVNNILQDVRERMKKEVELPNMIGVLR